MTGAQYDKKPENTFLSHSNLVHLKNADAFGIKRIGIIHSYQKGSCQKLNHHRQNSSHLIIASSFHNKRDPTFLHLGDVVL